MGQEVSQASVGGFDIGRIADAGQHDAVGAE
jgi:hypothetical protein